MPIGVKTRRFFDEIGEYCLALWRHWATIVSGAVLSVIAYTYGARYRANLPPKLYLAILASALFVAAFLAWRDECRKSAAAERERDKLVLAVGQRPPQVGIAFHDNENCIMADNKVIVSRTRE